MTMRTVKRMAPHFGLMLALMILSPSSWQVLAEAQLKDVVDEQVKTDELARKAQGNIDQISEETKRLLDEYRVTLREIESTKVYNQHMQRMVSSQAEEIISVEEQIGGIEHTHKEVVPLMLRMLAMLEEFVAMDAPFLPTERADRLQELVGLMDRADVSTSEKYRRILEAYQVEADYGRTIESYRDTVDQAGEKISVEVLRVGRIALIYQTLDGERMAIWSPEKSAWLDLPSSYRRAVAQGLRVAKKQIAPDLLTLPILALEVP